MSAGRSTLARVLRFARRMACGVAYTPAGFATYTKCPLREVREAIATLEKKGVLAPCFPPSRPALYEPVRTACKPGRRCGRPACRLNRESKRLAALADKAAAS